MFQFWPFLRAGLDLLLPNACVLCDATVEPHDTPNLCADCRARLWDPSLLHDRGATMHFVGPYDAGLRGLVLAAKFAACPFAARTLGHLAAARADLIAHEYDGVASVPPVAERLRARRIDLPFLIAGHVARRRGWRRDAGILGRASAAPRQVGLTRTARAANLGNSFCSNRAAAGRTWLVIDDVYTTGATAAAVARTLRRAGAARVDFLIPARTPLLLEA